MYKSPIEEVTNNLYDQIHRDYENGVLKAVINVGFNVCKEELAKALAYDRGQYEKGWDDCYKKCASGWIPVDEKLPEENDRVLISTKWYEVTNALYRHSGFNTYDCWMPTENVLAWQPYPEAYRPKGE